MRQEGRSVAVQPAIGRSIDGPCSACGGEGPCAVFVPWDGIIDPGVVLFRLCRECAALCLERVTGYKIVRMMYAWDTNSRLGATIRAERKAQEEREGKHGRATAR